MEEKELKERFFDRFFYAEDGSCDWDRWRNQDPNVVLEFVLEELDKAERRGAISLYKELDDLDIMLAMLHSVEDTNDEEVHKIVGNIRNELKKTLDKLKLLEEENGKQNAR